MITPEQKLNVKRAFEKDPVKGAVLLMEMFQDCLVGVVDDMQTKNEDEDEEDHYVVEGIDGDDCSPEEVAEILLANPEFIEMVKGEDGNDGDDGDHADAEIVVSILKGDEEFIKKLKGKDGESVKIGDVISELISNKRFISAVKAREVKPKEVASILKQDKKFLKSLKGKDGSADKGEEIVKKINVLPITPDKQIDYSHIKNGPKSINENDFVRRSGTRMGRGTSSPVMVYDLSSQCDGVATSFTVPTHTRALFLVGTQSPHIYRNSVDWSTSGQTLSLTAEIRVPPKAGQTLLFLYVE